MFIFQSFLHKMDIWQQQHFKSYFRHITKCIGNGTHDSGDKPIGQLCPYSCTHSNKLNIQPHQILFSSITFISFLVESVSYLVMLFIISIFHSNELEHTPPKSISINGSWYLEWARIIIDLWCQLVYNWSGINIKCILWGREMEYREYL